MTSHLLRVPRFSRQRVSRLHTSPRTCLFGETDPKDGYGRKKEEPTNFFPTWAQVKDEWSRAFVEIGNFASWVWKNAWSETLTEFRMLGREVKEQFEDPAIPIPGEVLVKWRLRKPEDLKQWETGCDSDHGEGFSKCQLTINSKGVGQFEGTLSTEIPKDGAIKRAGYCGIRTERPMKSFNRQSYHDWDQYTHLIIRCRGDGRTYMIQLATSGYFDVLWHDVYHYPLYTRGGPYWQYSRIPFSKFYFTSKGRIQDAQTAVPLDMVTSVGITAADNKNGPFHLEIDFVGIEYDPSYREEFAYEMYRTEKNIART